MLPRNTKLGDLELVEVYEYFDRPVLFLSRNKQNHLFLSVNFDGDEKYEAYIFAPTTQDLIEKCKTGDIELRSVITNPANEFVYKVYINNIDEADTRIFEVQPSKLKDDELPEPQETLFVGTTEVPTSKAIDVATRSPAQIEILNPNNLVEYAVRAHTHVFDFSFSHRVYGERHSIPVTSLSLILGEMQGLFDSIGQSVLDKPTVRGPISDRVKNHTRLIADASYPSSFALRVERTEAMLIDDQKINSIFSEFFRLLETKTNKKELGAIVRRLGPRVARRYKSFANIVSNQDLSTTIYMATPYQQNVVSGSLLPYEVPQLLNFLDQESEVSEEKVSVFGQLVSVNMPSKTFQLVTDDGHFYKGRIGEDCLNAVDHKEINGHYYALIKITIDVNQTSGEERETHTLLDISETHVY